MNDVICYFYNNNNSIHPECLKITRTTMDRATQLTQQNKFWNGLKLQMIFLNQCYIHAYCVFYFQGQSCFEYKYFAIHIMITA